MLFGCPLAGTRLMACRHRQDLEPVRPVPAAAARARPGGAAHPGRDLHQRRRRPSCASYASAAAIAETRTFAARRPRASTRSSASCCTTCAAGTAWPMRTWCCAWTWRCRPSTRPRSSPSTASASARCPKRPHRHADDADTAQRRQRDAARRGAGLLRRRIAGDLLSPALARHLIERKDTPASLSTLLGRRLASRCRGCSGPIDAPIETPGPAALQAAFVARRRCGAASASRCRHRLRGAAAIELHALQAGVAAAGLRRRTGWRRWLARRRRWPGSTG